MNKKLLFSTILFLFVVISSIFLLAKNNENENLENQNEEIILFYGKDCPHCLIVEEYIRENQIQNTISFVQKEVYYNQSNTKELEIKAKICGLPTNSIGVPFLWNGEKCFMGDREIIEFFKQETNKK